ncbi:hypothetical protein M2480_003127 [Parabacteroides sp. PFB2-12]|uniref:fimbrial protein n=1 Tax=unclassified Parabacteroides TaxID=2649774 RepID=UPI002472EB9F|nr:MULTISPECIES: fimbrial protein [unclassified Parabacteroides]MDH6344212.1 hypothetical protein [Parabacteroides sp. PM6-13]MDH6392119.1 hypothetical protein [Parabacteroides sp. PFB2-12]
MKLRNIILFMCVMVAFSACRKEDLPDGGKKDARVSVNVKVQERKTKAQDPYELPGEANINSLVIFVFAEDGSKTGVGNYPNINAEYEYPIEGVEATSGNSKIVAIANAPANFESTIQSYDQLDASLTQLSAQTQTNLVMSSEVITKNLVTGDNLLGDILLTRVPARLQLAGVYVDFKGKAGLVGRQVRIDEIWFENVRSESHYFSVEDWGVVEKQGDNLISTSVHTPENLVITDGVRTTYPDIIYRQYVMENAGMHNEEKELENPTQIKVKATLLGTDLFDPIEKEFTAVINQNGVHVTGMHDGHKYVYRNYVYNITLTFGENSFDENTSYLGIQVTVVDWGEVDYPWEDD